MLTLDSVFRRRVLRENGTPPLWCILPFEMNKDNENNLLLIFVHVFILSTKPSQLKV